MLIPCSSAACAVYINDEDGKPFFFTKRIYAWSCTPHDDGSGAEHSLSTPLVMDEEDGSLMAADKWDGLFAFEEQARIGANSKLGKAIIARWTARKYKKPE